MAEQDRPDERHANAVPSQRHDTDCACNFCLAWFSADVCGTGRCRRCTNLIDRHQLDAQGRVIACP